MHLLLGDQAMPYTPSSGVISQAVIDGLLLAFANAAVYSTFMGGTGGGTEGGWYGYKHSNVGEGIFICRGLNKPFYFTIENDSVQFYKV